MKRIDQFENKKVLVLGLAKSGESASSSFGQVGCHCNGLMNGKPF